ncbi:hypothetical protein V8C35DRAFT_282353 [Trichoderma chlorosporum]
MPNSSTRSVYNGNTSGKISVNINGNSSANNHDHTHILNRFRDDPNHPPGYGQTKNPTDVRPNVLEELRNFDAKFFSNSDSPRRKL